MAIAPEVKIAVREWHLKGGPPIPDHPKLQHYITRRTMHLLKLCIVASCSASSDRVITIEHYQRALGWLLQMEDNLKDIFKALGQKGDGTTIAETYHFVYNIYMAKKDAVPEHRIIGFLSERVPSYSVLRIIEIMERSGFIEKSICANGTMGYIPKRAPLSS